LPGWVSTDSASRLAGNRARTNLRSACKQQYKPPGPKLAVINSPDELAIGRAADGRRTRRDATTDRVRRPFKAVGEAGIFETTTRRPLEGRRTLRTPKQAWNY
jgi:hypothetical protein